MASVGTHCRLKLRVLILRLVEATGEGDEWSRDSHMPNRDSLTMPSWCSIARVE